MYKDEELGQKRCLEISNTTLKESPAWPSSDPFCHEVAKDHSEFVTDSAHLMLKAMRVFEDQGKAQEWMHTRNTALGGQTPHEYLDTFEGRRWIDKILTKIEFGEFC